MRRGMIAGVSSDSSQPTCIISHVYISHGYLFSGPVSAILQRLVDRGSIKAFSSLIEEKGYNFECSVLGGKYKFHIEGHEHHVETT